MIFLRDSLCLSAVTLSRQRHDILDFSNCPLSRVLHVTLAIFFFTIYLFIYLFTDLFIERTCPQVAKANLGGPCLNKQITKKKNNNNMYI